MIGTCRMGADPATSVVNKWQQSWDVPNLFIVDGSVLATGGRGQSDAYHFSAGFAGGVLYS